MELLFNISHGTTSMLYFSKLIIDECHEEKKS